MGSVKQVKELSATFQCMSFSNLELLAYGEVDGRNTPGPESVTAFATRLADRCQLGQWTIKSELIGTTLNLLKATPTIQPISEVAIQIHVERSEDGERLARLRRNDAGYSPLAKDRIGFPPRQIPNSAGCKPVANIETGTAPFATEVLAVLGQSRTAGQIKQI
jgi:hypothetical protein